MKLKSAKLRKNTDDSLSVYRYTGWTSRTLFGFCILITVVAYVRTGGNTSFTVLFGFSLFVWLYIYSIFDFNAIEVLREQIRIYNPLRFWNRDWVLARDKIQHVRLRRVFSLFGVMSVLRIYYFSRHQLRRKKFRFALMNSISFDELNAILKNHIDGQQHIKSFDE